MRIFAGAGTIVYEGETATRQKGTVLTIVKPDNTVLVHDASGYQPAAWLTRPETVEVTRADEGFEIVATAGDQKLSVRSVDHHGHTQYPISPAGDPLGTCPDCEASLVDAGGAVVCIGCFTRWALPHDATVLEADCPTCRLPQMRLQRGAAFRVCIDETCDSLVATVSERFDDRWSCPDCGGSMQIGSDGTLHVTCPDCDRRCALPAGTVVGTCPCGLPRFRTRRGERCVDTECAHDSDAVPDAVP